MGLTAGRTMIAAAAASFALTAGTSLYEGGRGERPGFAPIVAAAAAQDALERGEAVLKASCQSCHDRRSIDIQAKSQPEWVETIRQMVEKGAPVAEADIPVLAEYLTVFHGPVPDGPGKEILLNTCTMCHDLMRIKLGRRTAEEWEEALITMLNEGAPISNQEFETIHQYLSTHFNVE